MSRVTSTPMQVKKKSSKKPTHSGLGVSSPEINPSKDLSVKKQNTQNPKGMLQSQITQEEIPDNTTEGLTN